MSTKGRNLATGSKLVAFDDDSDELKITPLGSGQEVGRSCHYLEFKGKKILLDFGIHPALTGMSALPFVDHIDPEQIDLVLISHFHLDHAGGLPWFLMKTRYRGKCYMTHPTKAIYRWLLSDYIKVSNLATEQMLYSESDLDNSLNKINVINFHEEKEVNGIKFWCYHAGHVLGAAMFMIQIAGIKILYTGDFSRQEDRHLMVAEIPHVRPDILMIESTYGVSIHEPRESRETRFTESVNQIVARGGRCLIPVFALGRAQELLLILDEYWEQHPELHEIPVYYASALAKKCMSVYQTYTNAMNEKIQRQIPISNPFQFKHISNLKGMDQFEDIGPCVIMASPGMMQSGLSRELFEMWCPDPKNGVIIAGYCVEGTLAKEILGSPSEVVTAAGQRLPLKCSVDYISFSAHTDFQQTSEFIRTIRPPNVVLVHGEMTEMGRLKAALEREYAGATTNPVKIFNPKNLETLTFHFRGEKMAKVTGILASKKPEEGEVVSGILVKKNFNCHIISPLELNKYSDVCTSTLTQRLSVHFSEGSFTALRRLLELTFGGVQTITQEAEEKTEASKDKVEEEGEKESIRLFDVITVNHEPPVIVLEWVASPTNDMYANAIMKTILKAQQDFGLSESAVPTATAFDKMHYKECLIELLEEMFGDDCVPKIVKGDKLHVIVDQNKATIDLIKLNVTCDGDKELKRIVQGAVTRLFEAIAPVTINP